MSDSATLKPTISFGGYQCDLRSGELRKNGTHVRLADQPSRLLAILLEHPGELITRQELQARLWPGQSAGDFNNGLNIAINKLRAALDDRAETPKFIETVPRRGYRFVGKIETKGDGNQEAVCQPAERSQESASRSQDSGSGTHERTATGVTRFLRRVSVGAAVSGGLFALWWFNPLPPPQVTHVERVTLSSRIDTPAKPVMDGERVYYLERDGGHWNLMQTSLGGGDGQRVEAPGPNAAVLDVSPGNARLLLGTFLKRSDEQQLWIMPAPGAGATRLGNISGHSAVFSPDGLKIAYVRDQALWSMEAGGSGTRKLADLPDGISWLAWSPDGRRLRFTVGQLFSNAENSLWEISNDGQSLHPVLPAWSRPASECCGAWTPDGRYYVFTSMHGGRMNIWALREGGSIWRRTPRGPFQLTDGPDSPFGGTPSRDGRHIYFYNGSWREELQSFNPLTRQFQALLAGEGAAHVSFSRDGRWMCYIRGSGLIRSRADGKGERVELIPPGSGANFPRWSPDAKWIAFGARGTDRSPAIYVVPADGGAPQPLLPGMTGIRDADWSGKDLSLVAAHDLEPADPAGIELLIVDFATRRAEKIPGSEHLAMSRWSPDGRFISATQDDQSQLKLWDVTAKHWQVIAHGTALGFSVWSPDSRYLYFQDLLGKGEPLSRYDTRTQRVELVAEFSEILKSGVDRCALYSITPAGEPILGLNRSALDLFAAEVMFP